MAGGPQDVAQRHAQDALVASSHRFRVFLGAARAGHFVYAARTTALFVRTQLICAGFATGRGLSIKEMPPLDCVSGFACESGAKPALRGVPCAFTLCVPTRDMRRPALVLVVR